MATLFEIGADLRAFADLIDELDGGEITDQQVDEALEAFMAELQHDQGRKLDGYVHLIKREEATAAVAKATADQFLMKARAAENKAKRLKDRLKDFMIFTDQKKATSEKGWVVQIVANGGALPVCLDEIDVQKLPERFQRVTVAADTAAIGKALAAGEELPFARLGERSCHLRLK